MNISPYRLAVDLGVSPWVSPPTVNDIVHEKRGITPEMAIRLAKYFGNSEQFWLNLQDAFAVYHARNKYSKEPRPSRLWRRAPRPGEGRSGRTLPQPRCRTVAVRGPVGRSDGTSVHVIGGLAFDRPDIFRLLLKRIDMHHPAEYLRHEFSAGGITSVFGRD